MPKKDVRVGEGALVDLIIRGESGWEDGAPVLPHPRPDALPIAYAKQIILKTSAPYLAITTLKSMLFSPRMVISSEFTASLDPGLSLVPSPASEWQGPSHHSHMCKHLRAMVLLSMRPVDGRGEKGGGNTVWHDDISRPTHKHVASVGGKNHSRCQGGLQERIEVCETLDVQHVNLLD